MASTSLRVFWPDSAPTARTGLLFGWASPSAEGTTCVVAHAVPADLVDDALLARVEAGSYPAAASLRADCGALPRFIGEWRSSPHEAPSAVAARLQSRAALWLVMARGTESAVASPPPAFPVVVSWTNTAAPKTGPDGGPSNVLILFRQPDPVSRVDEYYASRSRRAPPLLALGAAAVPAPPRGSPATAQVAPPPPAASDATLAQINASAFAARWVLQLPAAAAAGAAAAAAAAPPSCLARVLRRGLRLALWPVLVALLCLRVLSAALLWVLEAPLLPGGASLGAAPSSLARQIAFKLREFCAWPLLLRALQRRRAEVQGGSCWHPPAELVYATALFYDSTWRGVVDVAVGAGACVLLATTPWAVRIVLRAVHTFGAVLHVDVLRAWVDWLMVLPAGLKLNHFAGKKVGGAVISCIDFWENITTALTPFEPQITLAVGFVGGAGGFSLLLAMASDVLSVATVHIFALYSQFAWLHSRQIRVLSALWKLFRGKKLNALRARVDSIDFDLEQLLLGTVCFCVVFFLFPTTLVYYLFFVVVWLGILAARAALWWLVTVFNSMPAYSLVALLVLPTARVPAGVTLRRLTPAPWERRATVAALVAAHAPGSADFGACDAWPAIAAAAASGGGSSAAAAPAAGDVWFELHSQRASAGLALAPFAEALRLVLQRHSVGGLLQAALYGGAIMPPLVLASPPVQPPQQAAAAGGAPQLRASRGGGPSEAGNGGVLDFWRALCEASDAACAGGELRSPRTP